MGRPPGSKNKPKTEEKRGPGRPRKDDSERPRKKVREEAPRKRKAPKEDTEPRRGPGRPRKEAKNEEAPRKRKGKKIRKTKKTAKAKTAPAKDDPQLVVTSKTKEMIREMGLRCSLDFVAALNHQVAVSIRKAAKRCQGNNRQTVKEVDAI